MYLGGGGSASKSGQDGYKGMGAKAADGPVGGAAEGSGMVAAASLEDAISLLERHFDRVDPVKVGQARRERRAMEYMGPA